MARKFSIVILLIAIFSCSEKPKLQKKTMVNLLTDCMLMEAGNQVHHNFANVPKTVWNRDYVFLCKKHNVDTADFRQSMKYMEKHPEEFSQIMEEVITALQKEEVNKKAPSP